MYALWTEDDFKEEAEAVNCNASQSYKEKNQQEKVLLKGNFQTNLIKNNLQKFIL